MKANSAKRKVTIDVNGRKTPVRVGDTIELDFGWRGLVVGFETWTLDAGSFYPGLKIVVQATMRKPLVLMRLVISDITPLSPF